MNLSLSNTSIQTTLATILVLVMIVLMGLGVIGASVYRDAVDEGFQALDNTNRRLEQVSAIRKDYEIQIQEWKNLLLRGQDENVFYKHLGRFYDSERVTLVAALGLAEMVADTFPVQPVLDEFLRVHRRVGRKYRDAIRLYNASDSDPHFVADKLVAGLDNEPRKLLDRIGGILKKERQTTHSDVNATLALAEQVGIGVALLLMLGAVMLIYWLLNIRMVRPLHQAIAVADQISVGNLDSHITIGREDEIGTLLSALKTMQERLIYSRTEERRLTKDLEQTVAERERSESDLKKLKEGLEQMVDERTTELRETQESLVRQERLAVLGQMSAVVSHELRNPLGTIRTSMITIADNTEGRGLDVEGAIERIVRNIKRCDGIIVELLDYTRDTAPSREPTDVDEWLGGVLDELEVPPGLSLGRDLVSGVEADIDRDRLRRAVINIYDNACQAVTGNGNGADKEVAVATRADGKRVEIQVTDSGPGIADDELGNIFEPLYSTKSFGIGLGLPVVKKIAEEHGGGVEISSEIGRGTRVTLWLPLTAPEQEGIETS